MDNQYRGNLLKHLLSLGILLTLLTTHANAAPPTVSLLLNNATPTTGTLLTLTRTMAPGIPPTNKDIYLALKLPDGTLLVRQPDGSFSTAITAQQSNVPVPNITSQIFSYTFTGSEPAGTYIWYAGFADPGTLNFNGSIISLPLLFNPNSLPTLSIAAASVGEGSNAGTTNLNFTVTLSAAFASNVTVDYATSDGTALAASDYTAANATLTIPAGATTGTITVLVNADTLFEPNEIFTLTLSNPVNAILAIIATATGTIQNDDVGGINDTGMAMWSNATLNNLTVTQPLFPVQDADRGRDSNPALNSNTDGRLGFAFTKLDAFGTTLVKQDTVYSTTPWSCVTDQTTGFTWEVKTTAAAGGLRDANWTYSWFNSSGVNDAGMTGTASGGTCVDGIAGAGCDTEKYIAAVNAARLCGFNDWRLPKKEELRSIVDYSVAPLGPTIDTAYFPNTINRWYWAASPYAAIATSAWNINFLNGNDGVNLRSSNFYVRLVRGGF